MIKIYYTISGTVLVLVIIVCAYWYVECYRNYKLGCIEKISFRKFLEVYENAGHKVILSKGRFKYYPGSTMFDDGYLLYFSILDTFRYECFRKNIDRREHAEQKARKMEKIEQGWARDAEDRRAREEKYAKNGN